jgi:hypothetical protein
MNNVHFSHFIKYSGEVRKTLSLYSMAILNNDLIISFCLSFLSEAA